jgi:hypothetical protein
MGKALAKIFLKKTKVSLGEEHCIVRKVPFSHDTGRAKPSQNFSSEKQRKTRLQLSHLQYYTGEALANFFWGKDRNSN